MRTQQSSIRNQQSQSTLANLNPHSQSSIRTLNRQSAIAQIRNRPSTVRNRELASYRSRRASALVAAARVSAAAPNSVVAVR